MIRSYCTELVYVLIFRRILIVSGRIAGRFNYGIIIIAALAIYLHVLSRYRCAHRFVEWHTIDNGPTSHKPST